MKTLLDTSVLVSAFYKRHPHHERASRWLDRARDGEIVLVLSAHSIAEVYSVLTRMPGRPRIQPAGACQLIYQVEPFATVYTLTPAEYFQVMREMTNRKLSGGIIYDALIYQVALKAGADALVTFNLRDFKKLETKPGFVVEP